jgi:hypothetical protein
MGKVGIVIVCDIFYSLPMSNIRFGAVRAASRCGYDKMVRLLTALQHFIFYIIPGLC